MTNGRILAIVGGSIVIIVGVVALVAAYRTKLMTALEFVISKGATITSVPSAGERYDFKNYGFYSNNRAVNLSTGKKGTYNKERILFDDGTSILLVDIFK